MRIPVLATLLGLSLIACAGQISGGGGDDDIPETCGNGVVDQGEECDGSSDCTASCTLDPAATPRLAATVDKPNVTTQLMREEMITVNVTSEGGFAGPVNIVTSFVDSASVAVPLVTIAGPSTVDVAAGQTVPVAFTVTIPSNTTGTLLEATFKAALTSTAGNVDLTSTFAINPNLVLLYTAGMGASQMNHPVLVGNVPKNITVKRGATVGYRNDDNIQHTSHGDGAFDHESEAGNTDSPNIGLPGQTYMQPTLGAAPGDTGNLGCHSHDGPNGYVTFTIE